MISTKKKWLFSHPVGILEVENRKKIWHNDSRKWVPVMGTGIVTLLQGKITGKDQGEHYEF